MLISLVLVFVLTMYFLAEEDATNEGIRKESGLAVIFFTMVFIIGVRSQIHNVEALVTGLVDNWPQYLLKHRRLFTIALSVFMFLCGIPMCTEVY